MCTLHYKRIVSSVERLCVHPWECVFEVKMRVLWVRTSNGARNHWLLFSCCQSASLCFAWADGQLDAVEIEGGEERWPLSVCVSLSLLVCVSPSMALFLAPTDPI